jgi:3',5'-cyclic AMP phosphodiesterase CpdA
MTNFRVVQISDTHLSRERPYFVRNWDAAVRYINATKPDLVINTGDIALDGFAREDDLAFASELHRGIDATVLTIPGNHDLGDNPHGEDAKQLIDDGHREAYLRHFTAEYWVADLGTWRLVGLNAQLFGSGIAKENEQWLFLQTLQDEADGRPHAFFVHKPLFKDDPSETGEARHRFILPEPRQRLLGFLTGTNTRLVACGHVHQHRVVHHEDMMHVWGPSTAFVLPDKMQPRFGTKSVGIVEYQFSPTSLSSNFVTPDEMQSIDLTEVAAAYSKVQPAAAAS